jgi:hypothetical protein
MFETNQQSFNWRRTLGCLAGFIGGGLAFLSLLMGVCIGVSGDFKQDDLYFYVLLAVLGAVGVILLIFFFRSWRRP